MTVLAPVLSTLAAGGAAATLTTGLAIGSTVLGAAAQAQAGSYQAAVLQRQAAAETRNADRVVFAGQQSQADQDAAAAAQLGSETARQAASGFRLDSASFMRRNEINKFLARRDAQRIRYDSDVQAQNLRANAATLQANATAARPSFMDLLSTGLGIGSDLITGASLVNRNKAAQIRRDSVGVY